MNEITPEGHVPQTPTENQPVKQKRLFRESAMKRLANPEQLDRVLSVTTAKWWLAVGTLGIITTVVIIWSVMGEVSTYVKAQGILLSRGGKVVDAVALGEGTLTRIIPSVGDTIEKGALVGEISNPEAMENYRSAFDLVAERTRALAELKASLVAEDALIAANVAKGRRRLAEVERRDRRTVAVERKRLEGYRRLLDKGIVTREVVGRHQDDFNEARQKLYETLRERDELNAREIQRQTERDVRISEAEARREEAVRRRNELEAMLETLLVLAPVTGRVTEIKAPMGAALSPGVAVVSLETGAVQIELLIYLPPTDGKRVTPGMDVLVFPSTIRREEHGAVKGTVEHVSAFPVSPEGIIATLQNRRVAETILKDGAPYAGRVTLVPDPSTASGFAWTSAKGSSKTLTSGTLATAEVKVESHVPITLVVPLLKKTFGL